MSLGGDADGDLPVLLRSAHDRDRPPAVGGADVVDEVLQGGGCGAAEPREHARTGDTDRDSIVGCGIDCAVFVRELDPQVGEVVGPVELRGFCA